MKNQILKPVVIAFMLVLALLSISTAQAAQPDKLGKAFAYTIGATGPGGGPIFFVDYFDQYPGFTYLEAAPADASAGIAWCDDVSSLIGVNSWAANAVGQGQANTTAMLGVCDSGAANAADAYIAPNGTEDWFLPSLGEAMLMYTNLRQAGAGGFAYAIYWSSTESDANSAWLQYFGFGSQLIDSKVNAFRVRAVRAF